MRIYLFLRRRCSFLRARRNRVFVVSVLLLISGLYVLGNHRGSITWNQENDSPLTHATHGNVPTEESRLQFKELDIKDRLVDLADETQPDESVDDITDGDGDPGLERLSTKTLNDNSDDENTSTKSLASKSIASTISKATSNRARVKATNQYKISSFTTAKEREPSTSRKVSHHSQTLLSANSMNDAFRTTRTVRISGAYSYKSIEKAQKKFSEINEVSSTKNAAKTSKTKTPRSRSQKKTHDEMLINIPSIGSNISNCPQNFLKANISWRYGKCVPHQASPLSCQIVKQYYQLDHSLTKCRNDLQRNICNVSVVDPPSFDINVQCNRSVCNEHTNPDSILVLSIHPKDGFIKVTRKFQTVEQLEKNLTEVIKINIKKKLYFFFLRCTLKGTKAKVSQLVLIDPTLTVRKNHIRSRDTNQINVNILLLDSVSRAHFYRSLPKTIQVFKTWKNTPKGSPAKIFDFELFQALEGHTAENTHALFNGKLLAPDPTTRSDRRPVNPGNMFSRFSRAGYQTMWQEDLCWTGGWGLMVDLGARKWRELTENIKNHSIDHTGITHSSCEILVSLGVNSPFLGPIGDQICYNGRFQHSYFLQYTLDTLRAITSTPTALPLLSYMSLSVGHDHIGRRIQSLDHALVQYVTELSMNQDTLTVILSDHGNTYTSYTTTLEGRFEMFHPHLFLVVPNKVAERLGDKALDALRINQHRLVNIIDLHHTIMTLTKPGPVPLNGLFTPISARRTCQDFELRLPNLCVCEGWSTPASNDSMRIAFVEFAVGQLNNKIEEKRKEYEKDGRSCVRLAPTRYGNVRERQDTTRGSLITSMDIFIPAGDGVEQNEDIFHVEVESYSLPRQRSLKMKLLNFDRMTTYGKYAACADRGVPLKLCICSLYNKPSKVYPRFISHGTTLLGQKPLVKKINECVFFFIRQHFKARSNSTDPQSFGFELTNACLDVVFNISVHSLAKNIYLSRDCPFLLQLFPAKTLFFLSAMKENAHWASKVGVNVKIQSRLTVNSSYTKQ